jgi:hypothetical protein
MLWHRTVASVMLTHGRARRPRRISNGTRRRYCRAIQHHSHREQGVQREPG